MTTHPVKPLKRSVGFLIGMCLLMLGANLVWISYSSVLLPTLVEGVMTEGKGLVVGLIGFSGMMLANLVNILTGIVSDHSSSRSGRRTPAILTGALGSLPVIALPALFLIPGLKSIFLPYALPVIVVSYCGMQFFTNVSNGAWWPLLVDLVPEHQRGMASGIQGFMTMLGSALGILLVTLLNEKGQALSALLLIGCIFTATSLVNVAVIRGSDRSAPRSDHISLSRAVRDMFRVRTRVAVFFWLVLAMLLAFMGLNAMQFFARFFFEVYFPTISPDAAFRLMGGISLVVTMVAAIASGLLSDRIGRRSLLLGSMFASAITTLFMGLTTNFTLFLSMAAIRAAATGPLLAIAPALAGDLAPKDEAGQYMAYNNLSTGLAGGISSLIFGVILITMNKATFMILFVVSAIFFLLGGIIFAVKVTQKELDARIKSAK